MEKELTTSQRQCILSDNEIIVLLNEASEWINKNNHERTRSG